MNKALFHRKWLLDRELSGWLNITIAHSLTSEASTLRGGSVRLCHIFWHSVCRGRNSVFVQSRRRFLFLLQSTRAMVSLQATEQDKGIAQPAPLAAWHLESLFVFICHNLPISTACQLRLGESFCARQMLWHFWGVKDYHDLYVGDSYRRSWLMSG